MLAEAPVEPSGLVEWAAFVPEAARLILKLKDPALEYKRTVMLARQSLPPLDTLTDAEGARLRSDLEGALASAPDGVLPALDAAAALAAAGLELSEREIVYLVGAVADGDGNVAASALGLQAAALLKDLAVEAEVARRLEAEARRKASLVFRAAAKMAKRRLASAFASWTNAAVRARLGRRAVARMGKRTMVHAFDRWRRTASASVAAEETSASSAVSGSVPRDSESAARRSSADAFARGGAPRMLVSYSVSTASSSSMAANRPFFFPFFGSGGDAAAAESSVATSGSRSGSDVASTSSATSRASASRASASRASAS